MRTLQSYLETAPKPLLRELHARLLGKRGLLNNSLILGEVCEALREPARVADCIASLEAWQLRTVRYIYQSGGRGLEAHELLACLPAAHRNALPAFLLKAAEEMLLWRSRTGTSYVYHGFSDFSPRLGADPIPLPPLEHTHWFSHAGMLEWHLAQTLAMCQLGRLRLNAGGDLHRRSVQLCEEAFRHGCQLASGVAHDELLLLLQFLLDKEWLRLREGLLRPAPVALEFLRKSGFRLRAEILEWWTMRRLAGSSSQLRSLLSLCVQDLEARELGELFWPLDPASRPFGEDYSLAWEGLPRPVRELWLQGLLEATVEQGRLGRMRLSTLGREWLDGHMPPPQGIHHACLPNFELILSVSNGPLRLFQAACLARVENDEPVLRFTLAREPFLEGLRSGLPEGSDLDFLQWSGAPGNVLEALKEWHGVHSNAQIATLRVLRIKDMGKLSELNSFAQFLQHTEESIPGFGFVLKAGHEGQVREMLKHFGLEPPPEELAGEGKPLRQADWSREFLLPWPSPGETDYDFKPGPNREAMASAMGATKYSTEFQQLEPNKLLQVLRYAHVTETPLEAQLLDPAERKPTERTLAFVVQRLQVRRDPFYVEAVLSPGREVLEIPFTHIRKIRLQTV